MRDEKLDATQTDTNSNNCSIALESWDCVIAVFVTKTSKERVLCKFLTISNMIGCRNNFWTISFQTGPVCTGEFW